MHNISLIYGDGIGKEVVLSAKEVIDNFNLDINWEVVNIDYKELEKNNNHIPLNVIESIKKNKIALKGPTTTKVGTGLKSINVAIRQELDLFANIRPVKSFKGLKNRYSDIDMIIVRENTEGLYLGLENMITKDIAQSIRIISKDKTRAIADFAARLLKNKNRKKITIAHKANILKLTDGLFLNQSKDVLSGHSNIIVEDKIIDALCMDLVLNPYKYDIILAPNLYGDILSDLASGLVLGLGLAPGANIGLEYAVFEAVHGSGPDIAGKNIANPTALILSAAMMLEHIGYIKEKEIIEKALEEIFLEGKYLTKDLGGNLGTKEFTKKLINKINTFK
ncbi:isocitrate/isopropylmalate dehydrogenase family protein [Peptostreptococcaceae bacterium AGR-M142]